MNLVDASWLDSSKYQSLAVAVAAGYRPITPTGMPVVHYINADYYRGTLLGGPVLNTAEPQSLVYANTSKGAVLAGSLHGWRGLAVSLDIPEQRPERPVAP